MKIEEIIPDILEDKKCNGINHIPVKDVTRPKIVYLENSDNIKGISYPSKCLNCDKQFGLNDWPVKIDI